MRIYFKSLFDFLQNELDGKMKGMLLCMLLGWIQVIGGKIESGQSPTAAKEISMSGPAVINARQYGDLRNSAFIANTAAFQGKTVWKEPSSLAPDIQSAEQIAVFQNNLVISYYTGLIELREAGSGKLVWKHYRNPRSRLNVTPQGLEILETGGAFIVLDYHRKATPGMQIPFIDGRRMLFFHQFVETEMRYCFQIPPGFISGPSDQVRSPMYEYIRYKKEDNTFPFVYDGTGFLIDVLFDDTRNRVHIVTAEAIRTLPATAHNAGDVNVLTFKKVYRASLDSEGGVLAVVQEPDEGKTQKPACLARIDERGKARWACPIDSPQTVVQPPVALSPQLAYLLVQGELWLVQQGKRVWSVELPCSWQDARMTILADHSVLVTAGHSLVMFDHTGKELNRMLFPDKLTCRPIVDEQGNIYVAGAAGVVCLR